MGRLMLTSFNEPQVNALVFSVHLHAKEHISHRHEINTLIIHNLLSSFAASASGINSFLVGNV